MYMRDPKTYLDYRHQIESYVNKFQLVHWVGSDMNKAFSKATEELEDADDLASSEVVADGKLIVKEEIAEGHISLRARQCSFPIFPHFFAQTPRSEPLLNGSRRQAPASILDDFCWWRLCASRPCELPGLIM